MLKLKSQAEILSNHGLQPGGKAQKYIDSEVIRCMDSFVPFMTGFLKRSALLGTVIGYGLIKYTAPYARANYYGNKGKGIQGINNAAHKGRRGKLWFKRMKVIYLQHILDGVANVIGTVGKRH